MSHIISPSSFCSSTISFIKVRGSQCYHIAVLGNNIVGTDHNQYMHPVAFLGYEQRLKNFLQRDFF